MAASAAINGSNGETMAAIPAPEAAADDAAAAPGIMRIAAPPIAPPTDVPFSMVAAIMTDSIAIASPEIF